VNVIIFGAPGAGKGTQAQIISKKYNLFKLSTGDLLRDEIKKNTPIGLKIKKNIEKGGFASDDIVNEILKKIVTNSYYKNRIIFDGYPRTINQAKSLEIILNSDNQSINFIFSLNVSRDVVEKRILGRLVCEKCNKNFNEIFNKDEIEKHECGNKYLSKRKDDNSESIVIRYDEYIQKTKPVLDFYSSRSYFYEIDGTQQIQVITDKIDQILGL